MTGHMKKLLLLPVLAMSLMTACDLDQAPKITLDMWLENCENIPEENCGSYRLYTMAFNRINNDYDTIDYDNYVIKAIKEGAASTTPKRKRPKEMGDNLISYLLTNKQECGVEGCLIFVYENYIMTFADFYYKGEYCSQRYYYEYDVEVGKKVINTAIARADEVLNTKNEEKRIANEEATMENFLAKAEATTDATITYNSKNVVDENHSLLNALKEKEYTALSNDYYLYDSDILATYKVNEHLSLRFCNDSRTITMGNGPHNIVEVFYAYKPKFMPSAYYEEGHYGIRKCYAIKTEDLNQIKEVLDSLVVA